MLRSSTVSLSCVCYPAFKFSLNFLLHGFSTGGVASDFSWCFGVRVRTLLRVCVLASRYVDGFCGLLAGTLKSFIV